MKSVCQEWAVWSSFRRLLLIVLLLISSHGYGQNGNYFAEGYNFQGKVAGDPVMDVLQDELGFIWLATYTGLVRFDGREEKYYTHDPTRPLSLLDNVVTALAPGASGKIWVGSMHNGLYRFDPTKETFENFRHLPSDGMSLPSNRINQLLVSGDGVLWVTTEEGVAFFDAEREKFVRAKSSDGEKAYAYAIAETNQGELYFGGFSGIDRWNPGKKRLERVFDLPEGQRMVKALAVSRSDRWWVGLQKGGIGYMDGDLRGAGALVIPQEFPAALTQGDIWRIEVVGEDEVLVVADKAFYHLSLSGEAGSWVASSYGLSRELRFLSLGKSRDGVRWVGTNDGVNVLTPRIKKFRYETFRPPEADGYPRFNALCRTPGDEYWASTTWGIRPFSPDSLRPRWRIDTLLEAWAEEPGPAYVNRLYHNEKESVYFSTVLGFGRAFGFFRYDFNDNRLNSIGDRHAVLSEYPTRCISGDEEGRVWIGTDKGLFLYRQQTDGLSPVAAPRAGEFRVTALLPDRENGLLVGTTGQGLWYYHLEGDTWETAEDWLGASEDVPVQTINVIVGMGKSGVLVGSASGLLLIDKDKKQFRYLGKADGLREIDVKSIIPVDSTTAWFAVKRSLGRIDFASGKIDHYDEHDGIGTHVFSSQCSLYDDQGRLHFGGSGGLTSFFPSEVLKNPLPPPVVFTRLYISNRRVDATTPDGTLTSELPYQQVLRLRHDQNIFAVHFAALGYVQPEKIQYSSWLEGFEREWQPLGTTHQLTYTNLDPGTYRLHVKAANNDAVWGEEPSVLTIEVLPAWYNSWMAWGIYCLLGVVLAYAVYRFQLNRRLALERARYLEEVAAIRSDFYTNITHEFRTPITLIQGPIEQSLTEPGYTLDTSRRQMILRNCRRLLGLINRLLQINQLEDGRMLLRFVHGDVRAVLGEVFESFREAAEARGLVMVPDLAAKPIMMDYDETLLRDIITNLLSNAIKFTPREGRIQLRASTLPSSLLVDVSDNGPTIPEEDRKRIFERYYRAETKENLPTEGSGVGLSLSRQLAELMGGELTHVLGKGVGNTFRLQLPISQNKRTDRGQGTTMEPVGAGAYGTHPKRETEGEPVPLVLIVEDEADMADYLIDCIKPNYQFHHVSDGAAGVKWARKHLPDLIISDVMMPQMNGFALCSALKEDLMTSHIPVMLLTARVDHGARLTGFRRGADAYLTKPFDARELIVRCEQLLTQRNRLADHFRRLMIVSPAAAPEVPEAINPNDYRFVVEVRAAIERHLEDANFGTEELADHLRLSRQQLFRKLRGLVGESPSELIRSARLRRACELLRDQSLTVAEVAYGVGFRDPDYFSRAFRKAYGETPTNYRKNQ